MSKNNDKSIDLVDISQVILKEAARLGADQAEVNISTNKGFSVSARNSDVETVEYNQDKQIDVTVYMGKRLGSASLSDVRLEAVHAAVEAACHIAKFTDEDAASGLAEKEELAFNFRPVNAGTAWDLSVEDAIKIACQCEQEALSYDKRIISADEVSVVTSDMSHVYANSHGFVGAFPYSRHELSCVLVAKQNNEMERDYYYTIAATPDLLASASTVAKHAAERTIRRLGARRLPTFKVPVLFISEEARSLVGHLVSAISGRNIYRRASFLLDQLDQKIFPSFVHLQEHPFIPLGLGSAPFDDNGVATRENVFVEDGILRQYALGVYAARKLNMKTTGNAGGTHNLTLRSTGPDFNELLKMMNRGLLVTELMGSGVNIITGDYSRGAAGYWVENGEIQYPVHEVTIASKLQDMYRRIAAVGTDVDLRGNARTGSILIEEMTVAGS